MISCNLLKWFRGDDLTIDNPLFRLHRQLIMFNGGRAQSADLKTVATVNPQEDKEGEEEDEESATSMTINKMKR
jgi:hypothetical protein